MDQLPENMPLEQYEFIRRRVNRRVRGKMLYIVHRWWAIGWGAITLLGMVAEFFNRSYGYGQVGAIAFIWILLVGIPFAVHTLIRYVNRKAEELRRQELQVELQYEMARMRRQPGAPLEKPKRAMRLADDGEIEAYTDEQEAELVARARR